MGLNCEAPFCSWFWSYLEGLGTADLSLVFGLWDPTMFHLISYPLFSIYIKLLDRVIQKHELGWHQYAQDTRLNLMLPADLKEAAENLNHCLEIVLDWMKANKLRFNPNKMEVLLVDGRSDPAFMLSLIPDTAALPFKEQVHCLEVLLDTTLLLD